jgi:hypothetical protein
MSLSYCSRLMTCVSRNYSRTSHNRYPFVTAERFDCISTTIVNLQQPSNTNTKVREKVEERDLYLTVAREVFGIRSRRAARVMPSALGLLPTGRRTGPREVLRTKG